jgi:hypothetical protein
MYLASIRRPPGVTCFTIFLRIANRQTAPVNPVRDPKDNSFQCSSVKHTFQEFNQFAETRPPIQFPGRRVEVKDAGESIADAII